MQEWEPVVIDEQQPFRAGAEHPHVLGECLSYHVGQGHGVHAGGRFGWAESWLAVILADQLAVHGQAALEEVHPILSEPERFTLA